MLATQTLSAQQDTTTQTHDLKQVVVKATKASRHVTAWTIPTSLVRAN